MSSTQELADFLKYTGPAPAAERKAAKPTFFGKLFGDKKDKKPVNASLPTLPAPNVTPLSTNVHQFAPGVMLIKSPDDQYNNIGGAPVAAKRMSLYQRSASASNSASSSPKQLRQSVTSNRMSTFEPTTRERTPHDRKKRQTVYASADLAAYSLQLGNSPENTRLFSGNDTAGAGTTATGSSMASPDQEADSIIAAYGYAADHPGRQQHTGSPRSTTAATGTPLSPSSSPPARVSPPRLSPTETTSLAAAAAAAGVTRRPSKKRSKYRKSKFPDQMRSPTDGSPPPPRLYGEQTTTSSTTSSAGGRAGNGGINGVGGQSSNPRNSDAVFLDADLLKVMQELGESSSPTIQATKRPVPAPRESSLFLNKAELALLKNLDRTGSDQQSVGTDSRPSTPAGTSRAVVVNGGSLRKPNSRAKSFGHRVTFSGYDQIIVNEDRFSDEEPPALGDGDEVEEVSDDNESDDAVHVYGAADADEDSQVYRSVTATATAPSPYSNNLPSMNAAFSDNDSGGEAPTPIADPATADFESLAEEIRKMSAMSGGGGSGDSQSAARSSKKRSQRSVAAAEHRGKKDLPVVPNVIPLATERTSFTDEITRALTQSSATAATQQHSMDGTNVLETAPPPPPHAKQSMTRQPQTDQAPEPPQKNDSSTPVRRRVKRRHIMIQARPVDYVSVGTQCDFISTSARSDSHFDSLARELDSELASLGTASSSVASAGNSGNAADNASAATIRDLEAQLQEWKMRFEALNGQTYARMQAITEEKQLLTLEVNALRARVADTSMHKI